jgi:integrase
MPSGVGAARARSSSASRRPTPTSSAAGLDDPLPRFHDLRHGCATALARAGAPAYVIQEVLRHADLATSQGYIDRTGLGSQAADFLGRAFGADRDTA